MVIDLGTDWEPLDHFLPTMEGAYAAHPAQFVGQSPFFYYNPDPNPEARQHGHFTPHPHGLPYPAATMPGPDAMPIYAPNMYPRPSSSCSQVQYHPMPHHYGPQGLMTPVQSPQPMYQKPTILVQQESPYLFPLDTDCNAPSTPPLSSSGSAISSPPSSAEVLPTPVNGGFQPQNMEGVKAGCEEEVFSEILGGDDWTRAASPPMTPGTQFRVFRTLNFISHAHSTLLNSNSLADSKGAVLTLG